MEVKLRTIGNAIGCLLPKEEIDKLGLKAGDKIEINFSKKDPFWEKVKKFSKEDRRKILKKDGLLEDDFQEWKNL
jgi:antitoxin component of MazEF toxin-antitoxin module